MNTELTAALCAPNPYNALLQLTHQLHGQGWSRQQLYDGYLQYLVQHQDGAAWQLLVQAHNNSHPLENILDLLAGWCTPAQTLFANEPFECR